LVFQILTGVKTVTNETPPAAPNRTESYLTGWLSGVCDVLEKIAGTPFTTSELSPQEAANQAGILEEEGVWLRFTVSSIGENPYPLNGEHSFGIERSDALRLAQILMGESFNAAQEFSTDYQDALDELFRQFAGTAAVVLKPRMGGEVNLTLADRKRGAWKPQVQRGYRLKNAAEVQFPLLILVDPDLGKSLAVEPRVEPTPQVATPVAPAPATPPAAAKSGRNIELLLDVELPVFLRFGKVDMLLSNILELSPGSVVELDQRIVEPVELLVGGKVVAQGEVVVLDGHYALRITEVLNPIERLESLQR
jgi:flagellar motor switch protein FliN